MRSGFVAVENQGTLKLCAITVNLTFFDAGGGELASGFIMLETPMHLGCNGTCGLSRACLTPGQIGMGVGQTLINDIDVTQIASVEHTFSGLQIIDVIPTSDITATGITPQLNELGNYVYVGEVENNTPDTVRYPGISIFGLNSVGRPLFETGTSDSGTVSSGGSWSFETNPSFTEVPVDFAAYPDAADL